MSNECSIPAPNLAQLNGINFGIGLDSDEIGHRSVAYTLHTYRINTVRKMRYVTIRP